MAGVKSYVVKLRPVTPYFFGGENTFGSRGAQCYYAVSELMPQSSSLIGLVRFLILKNRLGLDGKDKEAIKREIGEKGFMIDDSLVGDGQDYGRLKSVSAVFITDADGAYYTRMPMDSGYCVCEEKYARASHMGNGMVKISRCDDAGNVSGSFKMKDFKNFAYWAKVGKDNGIESVREDSFIMYDERVGINKGEKNADKENFFKQSMIRFKGAQEFVFTVEIEDVAASAFEQASGEIVKLGASSLFRIDIQPGAIDWAETFRGLHQFSVKGDSLSKIILLSDLYLPDFQELYQHSVFVWGMSKTFRSIVTDSSKDHSWSRPQKSALYRVLPAGTVIYYHESEDMKSLIDRKGLKKSGFNLFV